MNNFKQQLSKIRCFIFDIDGVLTDGKLIVMPGELIRTMNIRDGYALKEAVLAGFQVVIISGGKSESVRTRLSNLGITEIHLGIESKKEIMNQVLSKYKFSTEEILYMGDDLPDYEVMKIAGLPCCPSDAVHEIKSISKYISPFKGGDGCVRDIIEQVLRVNNKWPIISSQQ